MGGGGPDPAALPCPVGGCGAVGPLDTAGSDGESAAWGRGGIQKLKKTWLTRHSEQSGPRCRAARRDGTEEGFKRAGKRPSGHQDGTGAGAAKRGSNGTGAERGHGGEGVKGGPGPAVPSRVRLPSAMPSQHRAPPPPQVCCPPPAPLSDPHSLRRAQPHTRPQILSAPSTP